MDLNEPPVLCSHRPEPTLSSHISESIALGIAKQGQEAVNKQPRNVDGQINDAHQRAGSRCGSSQSQAEESGVAVHLFHCRSLCFALNRVVVVRCQ